MFPHWRSPSALFATLFVFMAPEVFVFAGDTLPDTHPSQSAGTMLHAGPITLKFQDGELRYLRVGDREIVRRIYFGVREAKFAATDMPSFSESRVDAAEDHFAIHLAAVSQGKTVSYHWTADITGWPDGKIEYHVTGSSPADGTSARIGLCVLYGTDSLSGQKFETLGEEGNVSPGQFPELVSPSLVASHFYTLRYTLDGLQFSCGIAESPFDMEDQRNWGDSSFKAYNPMPYAYPKIEKDKVLTQTLLLALPEPRQRPRQRTRRFTFQLARRSPASRHHDQLARPLQRSHKLYQYQRTSRSFCRRDRGHLEMDDRHASARRRYCNGEPHRRRDAGPQGALLRTSSAAARRTDLAQRGMAVDRPSPDLAAAWTAGAIKSLSLGNVDEAAFADSTPGAGSNHRGVQRAVWQTSS